MTTPVTGTAPGTGTNEADRQGGKGSTLRAKAASWKSRLTKKIRRDGTKEKKDEKEAKQEEKEEKEKEKEPSPGRTLRLLLLSLVVLVGVFIWLVRVSHVPPSPGRELGLDDIYTLAQKNQLQSVKLLDEHAVIVGVKCLAPPAPSGQPAQTTTGSTATGSTTTGSSSPALESRPRRCYDQLTSRFHAAYPSSQVTTQQLIDAMRTRSGADILVDPQTQIAVARLVVTFVLPLLMLANLFAMIFFARTGDSSLSDVAGFGRIGRKRQARNRGTGVTFADVAGADVAVTELREVIDYLSDPARFQAYGASPPKGVLLFGPPGCGKTLLARATAGETGVAFFSTSGTEFVESLVGVGAARVRDLFRQVREAAPAIMFIDEIDALGRRRSGEGSSGGEREQTLNQLLVELDGFQVSSGIVLMGATNRPDILDPALLRPGRFDRHITLEPPDIHGRREILELHARRRPLAPDVDLGELARRTPGFTGADLNNVINEAALLAIRQGDSQIRTSHLSEAVLRVLHGPQRRGQLLRPEERTRLAFHEAGHALVATAFGRGDDVHRISIVARGRALAQSVGADADERALLTFPEMEGRLAMAMSGVAAEAIVFGQSSTTAEDDITQATALAREMVGLYGMSKELGRVRLLTRSDGYLGTGVTLDIASGPTMAEFDRAVRRLVADGEAGATSVLSAQFLLLEEVAEALLREETLEGDSLAGYLRRVTPPSSDGERAGSAPHSRASS